MIDILKNCSQIDNLTASGVEDHFILSLTDIGKKNRTVERILQVARFEKDKVDLIRACETQSGSVKSIAVKSYTAPVHMTEYNDLATLTKLIKEGRFIHTMFKDFDDRQIDKALTVSMSQILENRKKKR